jgi:hypothetical protein
MNPSNEFVRALDSMIPLEPDQRSRAKHGHFLYRAAIDELIWPMITTHLELSYPVAKLSRFAWSPASIHYDTVFGIFQYLSGTFDNGLTYTHNMVINYGPIISDILSCRCSRSMENSSANYSYTEHCWVQITFSQRLWTPWFLCQSCPWRILAVPNWINSLIWGKWCLKIGSKLFGVNKTNATNATYSNSRFALQDWT